jgi:HPt (histidine-containing phosphotransfer) domain-containing protein/CheY-like chemotaxis protein
MGLHSPLTVLIAEDNTINQKIILRMLEQLGYQKELTSNAKATLSALDQQPYQVVLFETYLFNPDELAQLQQRKQQSSSTDSLWLIAMRSNPQIDRDLLNQVSVDAFLDKPLKFTALQQTLETFEPFSLLVNPQPTEILDQPTLQALRDVMGEDFPKVWRDLIKEYLKDAQQLVEQIETARKQEDAIGLQRAAHTLKSSSAAIGAKHFSQICLEIEKIGHSGQTQAAKPLYLAFDAEYSQVKAVLKQELG